MQSNRYGGYISKIIFNNNEKLDIAKDDIVIFTGPNNVGKSQCLKDIYQLSYKKLPTTVISDIEIKKYNSSLSEILKKLSTPRERGTYTSYYFFGNNITVSDQTDDIFFNNQYLGEFRDVFIANLDTSARLIICDPPENIKRDAPKTHPIHYVAFDSNYRKWLSDNFKKAFKIELTPNTQYGAAIPLCIGRPIHFNDEFEDEQTRLEKYAEILSDYKQVQNQGDGIRSFTGILLYLMLDNYNTYLIDEPESFLHPPQARIMGQIIGQTLTSGQQAFISTHSEEIIKGLLEVCPKRIKLVRITRNEDINNFSVLNNNDFSKIWSDPLLRYSNIMSSLFHKSVVLCESDSDCKMYSIIENHIKQKRKTYSETLFIHCGGKHRMAKIITALRTLHIDVKLIVDIDVLNNETVFKGIIEAYGIIYSTLQSDYNNIVSNLHSPKEHINRSTAKVIINQILDSSKSKELTNNNIKEIKEILSPTSIWDGIKKSGITAIPAGDATSSFNKINRLLMMNNIFIVPVGELECFVKDIGGHGPNWVNRVIESFPDLDDVVYQSITDFVNSMEL